MEDISVEVDCTLPEEPVRDSWGLGRTSQLDIQSQNYAFMHFHLQLKGSRHIIIQCSTQCYSLNVM